MLHISRAKISKTRNITIMLQVWTLDKKLDIIKIYKKQERKQRRSGANE